MGIKNEAQLSIDALKWFRKAEFCERKNVYQAPYQTSMHEEMYSKEGDTHTAREENTPYQSRVRAARCPQNILRMLLSSLAQRRENDEWSCDLKRTRSPEPSLAAMIACRMEGTEKLEARVELACYSELETAERTKHDYVRKEKYGVGNGRQQEQKSKRCQCQWGECVR